MKRLLLLFFTISLFTLAVNTVNAATNVSDCGTLNSENTTYQLNQSINSSFDCIIINATNITLDCAGYNITYGNETGGYGVANVNEDTGTGYNNVTVKNCVIIQNQSGFGERAIHFGANSETGLIENNTITVYGNDTSGILMGDNSIDGVIFNNTIISYGNLSFMDGMGGIFLETETSGMNVSSNNITTSGIYGTGIWVWGSNHSVDNNNITTSGEAGDGIYLGDVLGVNLSSNILTISGNVSYGIYSEMSENSSLLFYNNVITTSANHSDGIHLRGNNYNNISSNNITTSGYDSFGVYFNQSHNITLSNNIIKTGKSDSYVLCLLTSSNVTFYNNIFNASTSGSGVNITNSDLSYFNTTNSSATNIVGKSYIGGNFWTNTQGNGYSDLCTNLDSDYFCDSAYNIVTASNDNRDYLPLTTHTGFKFTGTVMDVNGSSLNNSVINISIYSMSGGPPTVVGYNTTTSNATGYFSLVVAGNATSNLMYKLVITHTNTTNNYVDYVGQTLPIFPYSEFSRLSNINFYLKEAGTISITAINSTDDLVPFGYMIKDTKLGYEISMDINTSSSGALVYVPKDRNYSIMIWPASIEINHFVPESFNWNNFTSSNDYNISTISSYNVTTKMLNKQFNVTESFAWISGYINDSTSAISSWDNFTVVPYLLEPSDMIFMSRGGLPYNASAWRNENDTYDLTSGFYNITLPYASSETVRYMLFAAASNGTNYRGSYRNITVTGDQSINFTMYGLLGSFKIINMSGSMGGNHIVNTTKQSFNLVNSTEILSNMNAHTKTKVDYSGYECMEFTFMEDISSSTGTFYIPLLNVTGIKEINVYSQIYAPKRVPTKTAAQITSNPNITMAVFSPRDIEGTLDSSQISVELYKSNSTCDVPNPDSSCVLVSSTDLDNFNPLSAVIGGGALSFRMGLLSSGITIHYINVDMLASGPPDGLFDSSPNESTSGGFESILKFGSNGPTIYDYVLISMSYTQGSTSQTGLNESADVNMSIPLLYDEDWNIIWDTSLNGTNGTLLAENYSHYSTHSSEWQILMEQNNCTANVSEFNQTNPCYIDKTNNRIWVRLPHFSGAGPSITGSVITASAATVSPSSGNSEAGGGSSVTSYAMKYWSVLYPETPVSWEINKTNIAITQVDISVNNQIRTVKLTINNISTLPSSVKPITGKVHQYLNITPNNINETEIKSAKLKFRVDREWITENNIDENTVSLNRYNNGLWNKLATTKSSEDATYIYYQAETPGFSIFAITGESKISVKQQEGVTTTTISTVTTTTISSGLEKMVLQKGKLVLTIVAIVVLLAIIFFIFSDLGKNIESKSKR